jgi:glucosamine--fructose-6-phosphate aminotransferase (isomerizing)
MLKEIYEQPEAIQATISSHINSNGQVILDRDPFSVEQLRSLQRITIIASGASRHAGLAGKIMIEDLAGVAVDVEHASEYCYRKPVPQANSLAIVITQSGETGDTLAAQRTAAEAGLTTLSICNVADSTIVREADGALFTYAGKEIAIPATKSFTTQLTALYLFSLYLGSARGTLGTERIAQLVHELREIPRKLDECIVTMDAEAARIARDFFQDQSFLILGRAVHHPIALEAALKLKESAYIHAEGYAAGEVRHGPTALVDQSTPVIVIATRDESDPDSMVRYGKSVDLAQELRAQSGRVIVIASEGDPWAHSFEPNVLRVPRAPELLLPLLDVVPLQLLAYYIAILNGINVDAPRNLAKFVQED